MNVLLSPSTRKDKKYMVKVHNRTIHFGAAGYSDFTQHKDPVRKASYLQRHMKNEDWSDPLTAGFWARWLLWNKPTLNSSITDVNKRFKNYISINKK